MVGRIIGVIGGMSLNILGIFLVMSEMPTLNKQLEIPILFLVFNRPDTTKQVFEAIRMARPTRLYVAADGPRPGNVNDIERVKKVRNIVSAIDWECDVKILYRDVNLGCKHAVSTAISWFFEREDMGIILEDDCLPKYSFFLYCEQMLRRYQNDHRIGIISGYSEAELYGYLEKIKGDYFYSKLGSIWGWATWRRVWAKYKSHFDALDSLKNSRSIEGWVGKSMWRNRFNIFTMVDGKGVDTWDYQLSYLMLTSRFLACVPKYNLVENIGFGADATRTFKARRHKSIAREKGENIWVCDGKFNTSDNIYDKKIAELNFIKEKLILFARFVIDQKENTLRYFGNILKVLFSPLKQPINEIEWRNIEYFDLVWNDRSAALYEMIRTKKPKYIYDFGCGTQFLRALISPESKYVPVDYKSRSHDTIVCDLNLEFPIIESSNNAAILSGVMEYIASPTLLIKKLRAFDCVAISYCSLEKFSNSHIRLSHGWVNAMTHSELVKIFEENDFILEKKGVIKKNDIFLFVRKITPA